ncbi:MAG: GDP-mannose 4,6-dehydratase [Actinobacteria bacterium]|nr:GDP-mannose 4,6-dehydratase [Actinomycetota bacterium]
MGENWLDKCVLVTGATGMIGSFLVRELLGRGSRVVVLIKDMESQSGLIKGGDIKKVTVVNGSLEDYWTLEQAINKHQVQTVFHLGAQTIVGAAHRSPLPTFEANIRGTYNLLEACRVHMDLCSRIVVASSDKAYGEQPVLPYTEEMSLVGRHPYEVSKSCADILSQSYYHTYDLPVAIARCGNVYGGNDLNFSRIVPGTIRSLLRGEPPVIRSDGTYVRDYVYVKDVVGAYLRLAERMDDDNVRGKAFNFSIEKPATVLEVVSAIRKLMNLEHLEPIVLGTARGEIKNQVLDSGKARKVLGWCPDYSLEEGLSETISWYEDFFDGKPQSADS